VGVGARCAVAPARLVSHWAALLLSFACGDASDPAPLAQRDQPIIRGALAESEELQHTGALVVIDPDAGVPSLFCTATLIGPETVVTAKHCALTFFQAEALGLGVAWLAGPSVSSPVEVIPIVAAELAPIHQGGFLGIGRDVAVGHLEHSSAISPVEPQPLGEEQLGESMVSIGYGIFSPIGTEDARRRIGSETVAAIRGRTLEGIFGSFENYVEWNFTGSVTDSNFLQGLGPGNLLIALLLPSLRSDFDSVLLLDGYEAVTGRARGDSQTCSGDSGGPLARRTEAGTWQTFGVVSGGLYSAQSVCDYGSVFATFGPETLAFLEQARTWTDPCGDVPAQGSCLGNIAARCESGLIAEVRRLVTRDCAATGEECFVAESVGCRERSASPGLASPEPASPDAASPEPADVGVVPASGTDTEGDVPSDGIDPGAAELGP
jgi:Trypsin